MKNINIGIQGGIGSFSEEAAKIFCKNYKINNFNIDYLISSDSVLNSLNNNFIDYGIFAMENAQGGVVLESIEALAKYRCKIIKMFYIPISQNLIVKELTDIDNIEEIHSHRQALRQCKDYLAENFWTKSLVEADDTAESARRLSEGKLSDKVAVIASKSCAKLYGLKILEEDIHDLKKNLTLFLSVKKYEKEK